MKIFISWSGDKSKAVANLFNEWLPLVIQALKPWVSTRDINSGSTWHSVIQETLEKTNYGIICLTKENKEKPWILYEAGALSKGKDTNRVCTFLIDLANHDIINNPLSSFNHTANNKPSLFKLITDINASLGDNALPAPTLSKTFEINYPEFEKTMSKILESEEVINEPELSAQEEILVEVLNTVRDIKFSLKEKDEDDYIFNRNIYKRVPVRLPHNPGMGLQLNRDMNEEDSEYFPVDPAMQKFATDFRIVNKRLPTVEEFREAGFLL